MFYASPLLQKNTPSDMNYIFLNTFLKRAARAKTDEPEQSPSERSRENAYCQRLFLIQVRGIADIKIVSLVRTASALLEFFPQTLLTFCTPSPEALCCAPLKYFFSASSGYKD